MTAKKFPKYFINLRTKCCMSDNWCQVSKKMYDGHSGQKQIRYNK